MPDHEKTLIMKFGGAAIKTPESFAFVADLILKKSYNFPRIAIVLSAMGGVTDDLIKLAYQVHPAPPKREYDMLVSAGERMSISLLAMALASKGVAAVSFTGSQSGIITSGDHGQARIVDVRPFRLLPHLEARKIVIVAGFQGVSQDKEITTLGRGGSDTTAVALAIALGAEKVEFYKDVGGIFEADPKVLKHAELYPRLSFQEALDVVIQSGGKVLHPRAIRLAEKNGMCLHVRPYSETQGEGTLIQSSTCRQTLSAYE